MITELDEIRCKNTFDLIDASSLEQKTKADLKESVEEAKLNLQYLLNTHIGDGSLEMMLDNGQTVTL